LTISTAPQAESSSASAQSANARRLAKTALDDWMKNTVAAMLHDGADGDSPHIFNKQSLSPPAFFKRISQLSVFTKLFKICPASTRLFIGFSPGKICLSGYSDNEK
jgi:hypothetical protein